MGIECLMTTASGPTWTSLTTNLSTRWRSATSRDWAASWSLAKKPSKLSASVMYVSASTSSAASAASWFWTAISRWRSDGNSRTMESDIDVIPLFETIDDLDRCDRLMKQIFSNTAYAQHLQARVCACAHSGLTCWATLFRPCRGWTFFGTVFLSLAFVVQNTRKLSSPGARQRSPLPNS